MKFLADENVSHVVVERLRGAGFDVALVPKDNKVLPDEIVLSLAWIAPASRRLPSTQSSTSRRMPDDAKGQVLPFRRC